MSWLTMRKILLAAPLLAGILFSKESIAANCNTNQRKSWTALTSAEKKAYINAELCLISAPPRSSITVAQSRFEELQWAHLVQLGYIHGVGAFVPWHRYFVTAHERLLQNECNYTGAHPYWDELADQSSLTGSEIFDSDTGFGGNGYGSDACVQTGPFANLQLHLNSDGTVSNYCLSRNFDQNAFSGGGQDYVSSCSASENFTTAWPCFEGWPHDAGHNGVGGVMANVAISAGDPLFFMHHAYIDKLFWEWQQADPARLLDMGGQNVQTNTTPSGAFTSYNGDSGNTTTMDHILWMGELIPNATIGDVMDITNQAICAEYV